MIKRIGEQELLELIYDNVSDAIFLINVEDGTFKFQSINDTFLELTGLRKEQIVGKELHEVIPISSYEIAKEHYEKAIVTNSEVVWEEVSEYPAGIKTAIVSIKPVCNNSNVCTHIVGIVKDMTEYKKLESDIITRNIELERAYDETILGWAKALELRDSFTKGHTVRVTQLAIRFGEFINLSPLYMKHLRYGSILHDIGKMGIPDIILLKQDQLSLEERRIIQLHPSLARDMLRDISYLHDSIDIPYCHHEYWNGSGYPQGLVGEDIPFLARMFCIVDTYDALISDRPYRPSWDKARAIAYILENGNVLFDPRLVQTFIELVGRG